VQEFYGGLCNVSAKEARKNTFRVFFVAGNESPVACLDVDPANPSAGNSFRIAHFIYITCLLLFCWPK